MTTTRFLFFNEAAKIMRLTPRAFSERVNRTHKDFWKNKVIPGYRNQIEVSDFEKYIAWLKRSGIPDKRGICCRDKRAVL
ncbi:MAG: hypothetical protein ACI37O_04375 [Candidatus Avelusimicrobium sp.]|uniref:hypothetical protein n=1 Tax=Candidatus Avelusimicrobium sp. TaxID=3048833 RepID=UPI003EFDCC6D